MKRIKDVILFIILTLLLPATNISANVGLNIRLESDINSYKPGSLAYGQNILFLNGEDGTEKDATGVEPMDEVSYAGQIGIAYCGEFAGVEVAVFAMMPVVLSTVAGASAQGVEKRSGCLLFRIWT